LKITKPLEGVRYQNTTEEMPIWFFEGVELPEIDFDSLNWKNSHGRQLYEDDRYKKREVAEWTSNNKNPAAIAIFNAIESVVTEIEKNYPAENLELIWPIDTWKRSSYVDIKNDHDGFWMGEHLDNRNVKWTCIMNLEDNEDSTRFHLDYFNEDAVEGREKEFYAPTKKGSGVFYFNHHALLHSIGPTSGKDRYIAFQMNLVK